MPGHTVVQLYSPVTVMPCTLYKYTLVVYWYTLVYASSVHTAYYRGDSLQLDTEKKGDTLPSKPHYY